MNINDPNYPKRRSYRLEGYNYCLSGGYFITVCTSNMVDLFGYIHNSRMVPNTFGSIVEEEWFKSSKLRENIELYKDEFVLMPNHIHGILWIMNSKVNENQTRRNKPGSQIGSLGSIIGQFKSRTSKRINILGNSPGKSIWQRNYYDHIIRNEKDLKVIRKYILGNPYKWEEGVDFIQYEK